MSKSSGDFLEIKKFLKKMIVTLDAILEKRASSPENGNRWLQCEATGLVLLPILV